VPAAGSPTVLFHDFVDGHVTSGRPPSGTFAVDAAARVRRLWPGMVFEEE
jgi:hypothetical protein